MVKASPGHYRSLPKNILPLTALRGVAALWVLGFHLHVSCFLPGTGLAWIKPWAQYGYMGVDLFFILSGFVLSHVYLKRFHQGLGITGLLHFWGLRMARVFPLHYLILLLYVLSVLVQTRLHGPIHHAERYSALSFLWNVLNIQAWGVSHQLTWNIVSWSVSAEWFAYLCFPFLAWLISRFRWATDSVFLGVLTLLFNGIVVIPVPFSEWNVQYGLFRVMTECMLGICLYLNLTTGSRWRLPAVLLMFCTVLWLVAQFVPLPSSACLHSGLIIGCLLLIDLAASLPDSWSHHPAWRPWLLLGEWSYALYMVHVFLFQMFESIVWSRIKGHPDLQTISLLLLSVACIGTAAILYNRVETPCRQWLRMLLDKLLPSQPGGFRWPTLAERRWRQISALLRP